MIATPTESSPAAAPFASQFEGYKVVPARWLPSFDAKEEPVQPSADQLIIPALLQTEPDARSSEGTSKGQRTSDFLPSDSLLTFMGTAMVSKQLGTSALMSKQSQHSVIVPAFLWEPNHATGSARGTQVGDCN